MKKLTRKPVRFKGLTIGMDVHKAFIEFCVLDEHGDECADGRIKSTREELEGLLARFSSQELQVSLEACGCFLWIFDELAERLGRERVHAAQPAKLHVIAQSMHKTDATDAWWPTQIADWCG